MSKPKKEYKFGGVKLAVFENQGKNGNYDSYQLVKSYKDQNDQWQNKTLSLQFKDLNKVKYVIEQLFLSLVNTKAIQQDPAQNYNNQNSQPIQQSNAPQADEWDETGFNAEEPLNPPF